MTNFSRIAATLSFALALTAALHSAAANGAGAVVIFGDSLTAGYGVEPEEAFPALLQKRIADAGWSFEVVNAGLSGETTAAGVRRASWILSRPVAVFVLALGGNDGLRGVPVAETERNLQAIIDVVRSTRPKARVVLAGMQAPPNMGPDFTTAFRAIFPRLAQANRVAFVPFLLEGVGGEPDLNQNDGIHPNPRGHAVIADVIWPVLKPVLEDLAAD